jgi:hypothetical protein
VCSPIISARLLPSSAAANTSPARAVLWSTSRTTGAVIAPVASLRSRPSPCFPCSRAPRVFRS